mgnify:FL=1
MIKAIIMDFDGLIVDTETAWFESFRDALAAYRVEFPLELFGRIVGTHNGLLQRYLEEQLASAAEVEAVYREADRLHREKMAGADARDGVRAYLEEARQLGLRIGLASSSDRRWIETYLNRLGLRPYFEAIRSSDDVQRVKPDPELYLQAVEALNVRPSEALAFEDSVNGSKAAKAAGLRCVIVPNPVTEHLHFEHYDLRIRSMGDQPLADLIRRIEAESAGD